MRIALQYSGMIRTIDKCYNKIIENFPEHHFDLFISTWDLTDNSYKHLPKHRKISIDTDLFQIDAFKDKQYNNIKSLDIESYDISKSIMLKGDVIKSKKFDVKKTQEEMKSYLYKVYRCNKIREEFESKNNFQYDYYISLRTDAFFEAIPDISQQNSLYINKYIWEDPTYISLSRDVCANNMIFMSNDKTIMHTVSNLYNYITSFWEPEIYAEKLFGKYITHYFSNRNVIKLFDFKLSVLRSHGHLQRMGVYREW